MSDETRPEPKPTEPAAPKPSDALALRSNKAAGLNAAVVGLVPTTYGELRELATILKNSQAIPGFNRQTVETTASVIMQGMELGLTPVRACQNIVNIKGNMALKADLQLALLRQSGAAEYYDEGFEIKGVTDTDLADPDRQVIDAKRILALVKNVPDDAPYGWATGRRKGDKQTHTRVFTWVDADRAIIYSEDDEAKEGEAPQQQGNKPKKAPKPLAEKFNFKSWPQDMYPKRARSRLIGFLFSDVTAGLPSSESLEGAGDMPEYSVESVPTGPGVDELIAEIKSTDPEMAAGILAGFEHLAMSEAKRLAHLLKHKDDQKAGYIWLRDEAAKRRGANKAGPRKKDQPAAAADAKKDADKPAADAKTEPPPNVVDAQLVSDDDAREKAAADFVDGLDPVAKTMAEMAWSGVSAIEAATTDQERAAAAAEVEAERAAAAAAEPKPTKPRNLAEMVAQFQGKLSAF